MVFDVPTLYECAKDVVTQSVPLVDWLKTLFYEKPKILPMTIQIDLCENYQYFYATLMKRVYTAEQEKSTSSLSVEPPEITLTPEEIIRLFHPTRI